MYELEIKIGNKLKKVKNPRKARINNMVIYNALQIMTDDGKWHTICHCSVGPETGKMIVDTINDTIKNRKASISLNI